MESYANYYLVPFETLMCHVTCVMEIGFVFSFAFLPFSQYPQNVPTLNELCAFQVLDDKNVRRRFRASNYQSTTRVKPFICTMPMRLDDGWNQIQFNLADFTRRAYGTNYVETLRVQIHANCRIRRVYFSDRLYSEEELPAEFKLYLPVQNKPASAAPSASAGITGNEGNGSAGPVGGGSGGSGGGGGNGAQEWVG
jgi:uncharacterized membrane protein YgcG